MLAMKQKLSETQDLLRKRVVYTYGEASWTNNPCECESKTIDPEFLHGDPFHGRIKTHNFKSRKMQHFEDHMLKFVQKLEVDEAIFDNYDQFNNSVSENYVKYDILKKLGFEFEPFKMMANLKQDFTSKLQSLGFEVNSKNLSALTPKSDHSSGEKGSHSHKHSPPSVQRMKTLKLSLKKMDNHCHAH